MSQPKTTRLRDLRGWPKAVAEALEQFGHAYTPEQFALAGNIIVPAEVPHATSTLAFDAVRFIAMVQSVRPHRLRLVAACASTKQPQPPLKGSTGNGSTARR
jgi:hypothetical protein